MGLNNYVKQVSPTLSVVLENAYGNKAIQSVDVTNLTQVYDYITATSITKELFNGALYGAFADYIFATRSYTGQTLPLWRTDQEFGQLLFKTYTEPTMPGDNTEYTVENGTIGGTFTVALADVKGALVSDTRTWQVEITITEKQLKGAFKDESTLDAFFNQQMVEFRNSMEMQLENMEHMLICRLIADKYETGGLLALNAVTEYNKVTTSEPVTPANALESTDFLEYTTRLLMTRLKLMANKTRLFNKNNFARHTPLDSVNCIVHNEFIEAVNSKLRSNTFHENFIKLPNHSIATYWQGVGMAGSFDETSNVTVTTEDGEVTVDGVIACVYDEYALNATIKDRSIQSQYAANISATHTWDRANIGYYYDPSENGFILYLGK